MGVCLFSNNAVATLAGAVQVTDLAVNLASGHGAKFPVIVADSGDFFYVTLYNASAYEIVKVTDRVGDVLTVVRAQGGTPAGAFSAGDKAELRPTAEALNAMVQRSELGGAAALDVGQVPGTLASGDRGALTGEIKIWPSSVLPDGYLFARGQAVSRTTYAALWTVAQAAIAAGDTTFGPGDGSATFTLPNLGAGVFPAGSAGAVGGTGGSATQTVTVQGHALTVPEMPSHNHGVNDPGHAHGVNDPGHAHGVNDGGHWHGLNTPVWNNNGPFTSSRGLSVNGSMDLQAVDTTVANANISIQGSGTGIWISGSGTGVSTQANGGSQAHTHGATTTTNLPPFLTVNFIIKT